MKTTFHTFRSAGVLLAALALAFSPVQAQRGDPEPARDPGVAPVAAPAKKPAKKLDSREFLYETVIPDLHVDDGTEIADVFQILEDVWDIRLNVVYRDDAGSIKVPRLNLQNVSLIDLLEAIETLTDVSTDIIANSRTTDPIICFEGPKKPKQTQQQVNRVSSSTQVFPGMFGAENPARPTTPGTAQKPPTVVQLPAGTPAPSVLKVDPDTPYKDVIRQIQSKQVQQLNHSPYMKVFPLDNYTATSEDIIDFIEQLLALGAGDGDKKTPAVRTLYHPGTKSLIVRATALQMAEIEEALEQLHGKNTGAAPAGRGRSTGSTHSDPFHAPAPPKKEAADPFGSPAKKPAAPARKPEADPFG